MAEYIEREAASKMYDGIPMWGSVAQMMLDCIPTADVVERKRGEWVCENGKWYCSICKTEALYEVSFYGGGMYHDLDIAFSNFCPNCGADMRGEN